MIKDVNSPVNTAHTGNKVGSNQPKALEHLVIQVVSNAVIMFQLNRV